jgi:hypothetical protein
MLFLIAGPETGYLVKFIKQLITSIHCKITLKIMCNLLRDNQDNPLKVFEKLCENDLFSFLDGDSVKSPLFYPVQKFLWDNLIKIVVDGKESTVIDKMVAADGEKSTVIDKICSKIPAKLVGELPLIISN